MGQLTHEAGRGSCLGDSHEDGGAGQGDGGDPADDVRQPPEHQGPDQQPEHAQRAGEGAEVAVVADDVPLHGHRLGEVRVVVCPLGAHDRAIVVSGTPAGIVINMVQVVHSDMISHYLCIDSSFRKIHDNDLKSILKIFMLIIVENKEGQREG